MILRYRHKRRIKTCIQCIAVLLSVLCCIVSPLGVAAIDDEDSAQVPPPLSDEAYNKTYEQTRSDRLISLNFNNIKTRQLLQIFAQFTKLNFVISDNVKGSMSIHLKNVPWPQALNVILRSQGLGQQRYGRIVLVAPVGELASHELQTLEATQKKMLLESNNKIQALQAANRIEQLVPLFNTILTLRFAKAEAIGKLLTGGGLLTPRGQVSVDNRTNSLWIRGSLKQIKRVSQLVRKLDFPVKQVVIEARIVDIERPFEEELGIRLGRLEKKPEG